MVPLLRASAMSFVWPTTVSCHIGLLEFACTAVFGVDGLKKRHDDSILSQSISFEPGKSAFLAVASMSGISQHGSFERVNCLVAWESFCCSALLIFYICGCTYAWDTSFLCGNRGNLFLCVKSSWFQQIIMQYVNISPRALWILAVSAVVLLMYFQLYFLSLLSPIYLKT